MSDLALLTEAAEEAGRIAAHHFERGPKIWEKPEGAGPVTEADLEVDAALQARLGGARPDYGWLSEECEDDPRRLTTDRQFIVDPIDGTRAFIEGSRTWAHSLAVAEGGVILSAVIYLPLRDLLFTAEAGKGAALNGAPIEVTPRGEITGAQVLSNKAGTDPAHWGGAAPEFERHFRSSLAYRMGLVAQGRFDAMLTLRPTWEWDIAAGQLIVAEAGGRATDRRGMPLRFNNPRPQVDGVVAAGGLHAPLIDRLAAA